MMTLIHKVLYNHRNRTTVKLKFYAIERVVLRGQAAEGVR